jgi:predicted amino acid-binding ACT domain protein
MSFASRVMSIPKKHPFAFGVGFALVKTSAIDLLVQKVVERKEQIDWKRNATFSSFGLFCLGGIQYGLYVKVFGRIFPKAAAFAAKPLKAKLKDVRGMANVGAQTFLDQCMYHPFVYFPIFYCTKEAVMADKPDFTRALGMYRANFQEDMIALWKVWVPFTMINFSFMPMHLRVPFTAVVSMVWTCILSAMRGGDALHGDEMAGGAVTGATLSIMTEALDDYFTCPVELNPELNHICISAAGPDRVGVVAQLARIVSNQGGNVTYSNQVRLGQEFIILMHVAVPPEKARTLQKALKSDKKIKTVRYPNTISHETRNRYL